MFNKKVIRDLLMRLLGILTLLVGVIMIISCFKICRYAVDSARIHLSLSVIGELGMVFLMTLYGFIASIVGLFLIFNKENNS